MRKPTVPSKLGDLMFECVIRRENTYNATVPRYPVENGTFVSDSILKHPMRMTLEIMVTDHPLTWSSWMLGGNTRVADVRKSLLDMYYAGGTYTLTTPDNIYDNMAIESLRFPEDNLRNGMVVTISLVQVNITSADIAVASSYTNSGDTGTYYGTTETTEVGSANAANYLDTTYSGTTSSTGSQTAQLVSGTEATQLTSGTQTAQLSGGTPVAQLTAGDTPLLGMGSHIWYYFINGSQLVVYY